MARCGHTAWPPESPAPMIAQEIKCWNSLILLNVWVLKGCTSPVCEPAGRLSDEPGRPGPVRS